MKANSERINGALLYATRHNHSTESSRMMQAVSIAGPTKNSSVSLPIALTSSWVVAWLKLFSVSP